MRESPQSSTTERLATIVIPAHNEANVINRCLDGVSTSGASDFHIVVVSNGSTDDTVAIARKALSHIESTTVTHIDTASKIAALRVGDTLAPSYPRIYLDADVTVSYRTLTDLADALRAHHEPVVGAPAMVVNTHGCGWMLTAYHNVWTRLPYVRDGVIGSGIYGVNEAGGRLKGEFPQVLNDDAYVRGIFEPASRITTPGYFMVSAPRTVLSLIRRRARVHVGNIDVDVDVAGSGRSTTSESLIQLLRGRQVPASHVAVYLTITIAAMALARVRRLRGSDRQWSTDATSRILPKDAS